MTIEPTAKVIEDMAKELEDKALKLYKIAKLARDRNDFEYAGEAASVIMKLMGGIRLDLLVTRPLREIQKIK